ncbi:hypothetical protein EZE46_28215 [Bacillus sp. BH2]|uniref:binary toxin-like calcium binding domain-containing protein n=1 Tax=Bacillus sp. BH2 TaxID=2528958 RepID=UPI0010650E4E|nr:binary toxin-like calcium binding domain-containing protein [Bacillus sp. BH2]TEA45630.1 hypothetical protein EZE46_28215 [Bacillus sp. BH2]
MKNKIQLVEKTDTDNLFSNGLLGFYFSGENFNDLLLITQKRNSDLSLEKKNLFSLSNIEEKKIKSARWLGYLKPQKTDEYVFSTSLNDDVLIQIDNNVIVAGKTVKLEKGKIYQVRIECKAKEINNNLENYQLFWTHSNKREIIPQKCLLLPNFKDTLFYPEISLFGDVTKEITDTDNDGIPDEWEENGYTFDGTNLIQWDSSYEGRYTKYVSNPKKASTVGDPYTDLEKVMASMDRTVSLEARNPLVAAYPKVGVSMEKLLVSDNIDFMNSQQNTISSSKTESTTQGIEIGGGVEGKTPAGHISLGFSNTSSTTHTYEESNGTQLHINTGQAAYLNANIRYFNTGTAPIYQVQPTNNFIIGDDTIITITAPPNNIGNSLIPGATYPAEELHAMALTDIDPNREFTIHYDSLQRLQGGERMDIETTQISGNVADSGDSWESYFTQIEASTACLILDTGDEVLERRIAARNYNDNLDFTPEITLGNAIGIAFLTTNEDGQLSYKGIPIDEELVQLVYDQYTADDFITQLEQNPEEEMYDLLLKQGMKILIKVPCITDDCNSSTNNVITWTGAVHQASMGIEGSCFKGTNNMGTLESMLVDCGKYVLSMYVKAINENASVEMAIQCSKNTRKKVSTFELSTDWKRIELEFQVLDDLTSVDQIYLNSNNGDIYFDDVTITKLKTLTSEITERMIQKAHTVDVDHWEMNEDASQIHGVYFKLDPEYICDYEVVVNGTSWGTGIRPETLEDGIQKVDFTTYNHGTLYASSRIQINTIYKNDPSVKAIVALWYEEDNINIQNWERRMLDATIIFYQPDDPGSSVEPYGWINFYSQSENNLIEDITKMTIWSKTNHEVEDEAHVQKEFYAPNTGKYTFYGDVKEHDSTSGDEILADPNKPKDVEEDTGTVQLDGGNPSEEHVEIRYSISYP